METVIRDIRLGARQLLKQPGFSVIAILTLGLGIAGSTIVFSVIDAALLRPLPYPSPDQLVKVSVEERQQGRAFQLGPSVEDIRDWRAHARSFSYLAMWQPAFPPPVLDGPQPERVTVMQVSDDYFNVHGVAPLLGRAIAAQDVVEGSPLVVVLGHSFWQRRFGGDRGALGTTIRLDNEPATVVGVLPPTFYRNSQIWKPLRTSAQMIGRRGTGTTVYGRLRPGVSIARAQRETDDLTSRLDQERVQSRATVRLESLYDVTTWGYYKTTNILSAAVAFILLIGCVNVAGLLLARGAARGPELAVRASLGATRSRLVRQLLTESLVLSTAGGAVGLLLAWMSIDALVATIPMSLPGNSPVSLNLRVFGFAAGLSLATGLLFGLAPAVSLSRAGVKQALAHAGQRHGSALSRRGGQFLIASEVALAIVLLVGAGLMIRSFARILGVDVGFDPESAVTMEVVPVNPDDAALKAYYPALVAVLSNVPVIEAVGAVDHLPLGGSSTMTLAKVGGERMSVNIRQFVPGYFEAIGFALKQGRYPSASERSAVPAAMLNERAARQMFPVGSAVGRRFDVGPTTFEVIGVVGDVRHAGPLRPAQPEVFLSFGYREARPMIVVVRSRLGASALAARLRQTAQSLGPRVVVDRIRRGSDWFDDTVVTPRRRTVLLGLLGGLAVLLALVGVFGMTAFAVTRRTQEIGVRMALGARPAELVRALIRDSMWPVASGILVGLAGATLATRVIASFLFETPPIDPVTFAAVAATFGVAASLAAWIPARRAARVDPIIALRTE